MGSTIGGVNVGMPSSTTNDYYSPTGHATNPSGGVTDASPFNVNPVFTNPAGNNYTVTNSTAISDITFVPLVTDQGPENSPFQAAGSAF